MATVFNVVFALYPQITQLDFTGPHEVLSRLPGAQCALASAKGGTIKAEGGLSFETQRMADLSACDLICVPGGFGTVEAMQDEHFLRELKRLSGLAKYTTSVCTGSLLLASAGLLKGKRAACHWAWGDLLDEFPGVTLDKARVVRDGNTFTGGGVTAGIDMAFSVLAEIAGEPFSKAVQLGLEYAPDPPFDCGHPDSASPEILSAVKQRFMVDGEARLRVTKEAAEQSSKT
jgi:cyclohexyl-isocyanide hydratase